MTYEDQIQLYRDAKDAYYTGTAIISDEEFDALEETLVDQGYNTSIGYDAISDEKKITHRHRMLSLTKLQILEDQMSYDQAVELFDQFGEGIMSWKFDGLAIKAEYTNGILTSISTRGSGAIGINVTAKCAHLFPSKLNKPVTLDIKSEVVMNWGIFNQKYSHKYAHPRNLAAGIVNDQNINDQRKHDIHAVVLSGVEANGKIWYIDDVLTLHDDFDTMCKEDITCIDALDIMKSFNNFAKDRPGFTVPTDGVVYDKVVSILIHNEKHPVHSIAIKFKPPRMISTVTNITWKLHKTGRYVPKIHFKPILVDGRSIKQATGHNLEYLVKHDIKVGQQIEVILSNDIIPMIKQVS